MKFTIKHEGKGRLRIHFFQKKMTFEQADTLQYYLEQQPFVLKAKVYERTQDAAICFEYKERDNVIKCIQSFSYGDIEIPSHVLKSSGRELNSHYQEKLVITAIVHYGRKLLPLPFRTVLTIFDAVKFIKNGIQSLLNRKIEVAVLDATSIGVSLLRADIKTAGSIMFLLKLSGILEEWSHKKSVSDLARTMSLGTGKVWIVDEFPQSPKERLVLSNQVKEGDLVCVHMGNVNPFDGFVESGEGMVNQASLTGEALTVRKTSGGYVYAGTALEEGELIVRVKEIAGSSRYEKIVTMIEETEKLKSSLENRAANLADKLVPWSLAGTLLTYLLTRNATKALSILMVDFSCALQLTMPVAVLSAMREAGKHDITVKGGKYLEVMAEADTIVFDKTGTLTKAKPVVAQIISFSDEYNEDELLRIAACIEEHFPHSMAKAIVEAAKNKDLVHEEMHSKVEYIVAHGIATEIQGKRTIIGSRHFVIEDEGCVVLKDKKTAFNNLPSQFSHLYMAIDGELAAIICVEDPLREEASEVISRLRRTGINNVVMMTGDGQRAAASVAEKLGLDEYYSEVLPEDKAEFIKKEKARGRKVIMVGDGINDSLALSTADVGIAISDGAEIAREVSDITIAARDLHELIVLKELSNALMRKIKGNYRCIVCFNTTLIGLGILGVMQPATSALLHNSSTLLFTLSNMRNLLPEKT